MRVTEIKSSHELPQTPMVLYFGVSPEKAAKWFRSKYGAKPTDVYVWDGRIYVEVPELLISTPGWSRR